MEPERLFSDNHTGGSETMSPASARPGEQRPCAVGTLEIAPSLAPLTLFIWSKDSSMVRITDFSITEEAFVQAEPNSRQGEPQDAGARRE
jgi:hypothetical protein